MTTKYKIFDHDTLLEDMDRLGRKSVLLVGNHKEARRVEPLDDEYVMVLHMNRNEIPGARVDMIISYLWQSGDEYPCRSYFFPRQYPDHFDSLAILGREVVYLMDPVTYNLAFKVLGFPTHWYHPGPTTGFLALMALEAATVQTRVAGFSWYMGVNETYAVANHNPMEELKSSRARLRGNPLFSFTDETLAYLTLPGEVI